MSENINIKLDYALVVLISVAFLANLQFPEASFVLWICVYLGALPTLWGALRSTMVRKISIDTFNIFAVAVSIIYGEVRSATFIILMLAFARLLDANTQSRTRRTLEELLKLKPQTAMREKDGQTEEIPADSVSAGRSCLGSRNLFLSPRHQHDGGFVPRRLRRRYGRRNAACHHRRHRKSCQTRSGN